MKTKAVVSAMIVGHLFFGLHCRLVLGQERVLQDRSPSAGLGSTHITSVAFSPDGQLLASCGCAKLWDPVSGKELLSLPSGFPNVDVYPKCLAFSPDGKTLAAGLRDVIMIWEVKTRALIRTLKAHHTTTSLAFSPDGKLLTAGGAEAENVIVFNYDDGSLRTLLKVPFGRSVGCASLTFSSDGKKFAGAFGPLRDPPEYMPIWVWDVQSGKPESLQGHRQGNSDVRFSADGKKLFSAGSDKLIKVWDLSTGNWEKQLKGDAHVPSVLSFTKDGKMFASSGYGNAVLWDAKSLERLALIQPQGEPIGIRSLAFSPDGKILAIGCVDKSIRLWDVPRVIKAK